jgi:hypothetical protein
MTLFKTEMSKPHKRTIYVLVGIIIILLALLLVDRYCPITNAPSKVAPTDSSGLTFSEFKNLAGKTIIKQKQRILDLEQAVQSGAIYIEELKHNYLKAISAKVSIKEVTRIKKITAPYKEKPEVLVKRDTASSEKDTILYLRSPQNFSVSDPWYSFLGYFDTSGVHIDSLTIFGEPTITLGQQYSNSWLSRVFGKTNSVVLYENPNPYAKVQRMENVVISLKPKWYERKLFWFSLGGAIGVAGTAFLLK